MNSSQLSDFSLNQQKNKLRILIASSEAHPLMKTGGLADVTGSLPAALRQLDQDARLILPAYPRAVRQLREPRARGEIKLPGYRTTIRLIEGRHPYHDLPIYLIEAPDYFSREGNPYLDLSGRDWGDNAERFALFCRAIAQIACDGIPALGWRPDVLHTNDWQTGLAPALFHERHTRPATVFTIHNLAYQGLFDRSTFDRIGLPNSLWSLSGLEFHQKLSFIKGGIVFSDLVNTVSPTYAQEICTPRFGCGLDGLLRQIGVRFSGILNGIDYQLWNPASDQFIRQPYSLDTFGLKVENKLDAQHEFNLPRSEDTFLLGYIGRLVEQKGVDLILAALPDFLKDPRIQFIALASGERHLELALIDLARNYPRQVAVFIGHDENKAHRIEAACDSLLMPSRFEPCGLNQLFSLRYGTIPIVHRTGGLADTVTHVSPSSLANHSASGFVFDEPRSNSLSIVIQQAISCFRHSPHLWTQIAANGMKLDFSWEASARIYLQLYLSAINLRFSH